MPKVSVIIPTYKRSELLADAIKSVTSQTEEDIEIIVVSDGVDEKTQNVVRKLQKNDNRILYFDYPKSKGGNYARNFGVKKSLSDIIAFLDDDDTWNNLKIQRQLEILNKNEKIGLVYTGINQIYPEKNISFKSNPQFEGSMSKHILFRNYIGTTSTVLMKKSVFIKAGGFDINLKAMQDYDLWIRSCQLCLIGYVKTPEVNYYNRSNSNQISVNTTKYKESFEYIFNKYSIKYNKLTKRELLTIKANHYKLIANKYNKNGEIKKSFKYSIKGFKTEKNIKNLIFIFLMLFNYNFQIRFRALTNK